MRRLVVLAAVALIVATLAVGTVAGSGNLWKAPPFSSIGIHNVYYIGNDFALGEPPGEILRVWMETGSASEKCLATMGEANHSPLVETIYCSSRFVPLEDNRGHWGVVLTLFLAEPLVDVDGDPSWYSLNVYQEGATTFGPPYGIDCDDSGCWVIPSSE
jgi:hypothetical protein